MAATTTFNVVIPQTTVNAPVDVPLVVPAGTQFRVDVTVVNADRHSGKLFVDVTFIAPIGSDLDYTTIDGDELVLSATIDSGGTRAFDADIDLDAPVPVVFVDEGAGVLRAVVVTQNVGESAADFRAPPRTGRRDALPVRVHGCGSRVRAGYRDDHVRGRRVG